MLVIFNIILVVLLIWAAVHDLRTRLIPNRIPALIVLLFLPATFLGYVPNGPRICWYSAVSLPSRPQPLPLAGWAAVMPS
ncbi:hypothetical protein JCM17845_05470 [Iodidimonas gelatinilytica]|uniref:Prepilin type IV endopeptidase peptidase domain-containing protein n=1 Tax=Iodidimonas gelatinilytica TaxID=1236966 RepID=A0A5A7MX59_9PROT|nr:hypothetical protein JCM17845_05470 [Iodidimonas gelatinilytica]